MTPENTNSTTCSGSEQNQDLDNLSSKEILQLYFGLRLDRDSENVENVELKWYHWLFVLFMAIFSIILVIIRIEYFE